MVIRASSHNIRAILCGIPLIELDPPHRVTVAIVHRHLVYLGPHLVVVKPKEQVACFKANNQTVLCALV